MMWVIYECKMWAIYIAEHQRIDVFELWCWRKLLRVPWTARRPNQWILKEINLDYSLEGLVLKLKLQYFGNCCSVVSDSLQSHGLQHARLPCPSPTLGACPNLWPLSWWCCTTISSSAIHFSSWIQYFPISGYFPMSQFFVSSSQSIGASAAVQGGSVF